MREEYKSSKVDNIIDLESWVIGAGITSYNLLYCCNRYYHKYDAIVWCNLVPRYFLFQCEKIATISMLRKWLKVRSIHWSVTTQISTMFPLLKYQQCTILSADDHGINYIHLWSCHIHVIVYNYLYIILYS